MQITVGEQVSFRVRLPGMAGPNWGDRTGKVVAMGAEAGTVRVWYYDVWTQHYRETDVRMVDCIRIPWGPNPEPRPLDKTRDYSLG